jgi:hypothetical protein
LARGRIAHALPDTAALAGLADIIASESPEQGKELLRLLVEEIRVHNRRRIVPTTASRRRFAQYLVRWS